MKTAIEEITGRDPELLPFEEYFSQDPAEQESNQSLDAMNDFLAELISAINSKASFDLDELILRTGEDPIAVKEIYQDLMKKLKR